MTADKFGQFRGSRGGCSAAAHDIPSEGVERSGAANSLELSAELVQERRQGRSVSIGIFRFRFLTPPAHYF
jgi:hypothetical protein